MSMDAPSGRSSKLGPITSILPSSTWSMSTMRRYSNARLYLPPNSTRMSFLRTTSPSNAEP